MLSKYFFLVSLHYWYLEHILDLTIGKLNTKRENKGSIPGCLGGWWFYPLTQRLQGEGVLFFLLLLFWFSFAGRDLCRRPSIRLLEIQV